MSDTPTCFFLNPSFQSAYNNRHRSRRVIVTYVSEQSIPHARPPTLATFCGPFFFFSGAEADFFPAFLDGAYNAVFSEIFEEFLSTLTIVVVG